jgi:biopolymer transport protein ExbD
MVNQGILKDTTFHSVIAEYSILRPEAERHKRKITEELLLTALIDAFSILVIFLLMNFSSTGDIIYLEKGMELPKAVKADALDLNPVIKIDHGKVFLENKEVKVDELTAALIVLKMKFKEMHPEKEPPVALTIQGDRRLKYEFLNGVVLASSQAGYSDIKFAVVMK